MNKELIIENLRELVKNKLYGEGSGHDWWHIFRVSNLSKTIASKEGGDLFIIELASLLHDIEDWKFTDNNTTSTSLCETWMRTLGIENHIISQVSTIIKTLSFKGGVVDSSQHTIEGKIVQDADRLDAIGAIGIARTFTYGGYKNRPIYDPNIPPYEFITLEDVKNSENHTINHFYEKLLKLKDTMNTHTGKKLALERHEVMTRFLDEFYDEWDGKK